MQVIVRVCERSPYTTLFNVIPCDNTRSRVKVNRLPAKVWHLLSVYTLLKMTEGLEQQHLDGAFH